MRRNLHQIMENYSDADVARSLAWFISFMSPNEWNLRRTKIEKYIEHAILTGYGLKVPKAESLPLSVNEDKICWYLYLMDNCLNDAAKYEPVQGARILPIFKRIGEDLEQLRLVDGIRKKVRRLIKNDPKDADAVLFEILTALLWARNGWTISFIPETKSSKQPDIKAIKNEIEWFIECKRFSRTSDYTAREKLKWLRMMSYVKELLMALDLVLDVTIHVELTTLPDTFLHDELADKLKLIRVPGVVVSNTTLDVHASFVDYVAINDHLEKFSVRSPSPQLNALIGGRRDDNKGFTSGSISQPFRLGSGIGNNIFVDQVSKAFGVFWSCDAPKATDNKARDIKRYLVDAVKQLPKTENSVVHIGIETYDGPEVEKLRFEKIRQTLNEFSLVDKNLNWVYCHFFQSYAPPDQMWVFDESLARFNNKMINSAEPLKQTSLITPWDVNEENSLHWFKPQP